MTTQLVGGGTSTLDALAVAGNTSVGGSLTLGSAAQAAPSGSAPLFSARAWCIFDGTVTGTNAPTAGGNVATVTRNGAGDYTINFTTAMPDANYSTQVCGAQSLVGNSFAGQVHGATYTTTAVRILTNNSAFTATDAKIVCVSIFR